MNDILIVDGYNIIGAWGDLKKLRDVDLQSSRDALIDKMADYQGYTGIKVMIVFDAYTVHGIEKKDETISCRSNIHTKESNCRRKDRATCDRA